MVILVVAWMQKYTFSEVCYHLNIMSLKALSDQSSLLTLLKVFGNFMTCPLQIYCFNLEHHSLLLHLTHMKL